MAYIIQMKNAPVGISITVPAVDIEFGAYLFATLLSFEGRHMQAHLFVGAKGQAESSQLCNIWLGCKNRQHLQASLHRCYRATWEGRRFRFLGDKHVRRLSQVL